MFAAHMRQCVEPEAYRSSQSNMETWDVSALLPQITARTLVVRTTSDRGITTVPAKQRQAAQIPNARFQLVDDRLYQQLPGIIAEFLTESDQIAQPDLPSGTAIILFADIVDSTALTERLGDAAFRDKARDLDAALRTIIHHNTGTPIEGKLLGDGVLAVFTSARQAIEAALACGKAGAAGGLPLHLGLHAGDVIREDQRIRRRRQHRLARQWAVGSGGGAGVGDSALAGADIRRCLVRGRGRADPERCRRAGARVES